MTTTGDHETTTVTTTRTMATTVTKSMTTTGDYKTTTTVTATRVMTTTETKSMTTTDDGVDTHQMGSSWRESVTYLAIKANVSKITSNYILFSTILITLLAMMVDRNGHEIKTVTQIQEMIKKLV